MNNRPVLLIGDSITEGFNEKILLPEVNAINYGVSGDSTLELMERINEQWFSIDPYAAFLCIGTNDFARERSNDYVLDNIRQIINRIRGLSPDLNIYPVSIFPTRYNLPRPNKRIVEFNRMLAEMAEENGLTYFDIHDKFTDSNGDLILDFTEDGLHLTPKAYELWAQLIKEFLNKL
ncbi:MAG: GDSL-type esterase/lipase family protein [Ignavibacteriales bacterium]